MGGIVPLIMAIYLYSRRRLPFTYIVMRARRATMLGADRELFGELISVSNCY